MPNNTSLTTEHVRQIAEAVKTQLEPMNAKIKELEEANDALMLRVDELEERVETLENA